LNQEIDVETGRNGYRRVTPFGDKHSLGIFFVEPGPIVAPESTDRFIIRIVTD
jgi:hypothetical protein